MYRSATILLLGFAMTSSLDGTSNPIDRVEEDWQLVIRTTDAEAVGPQITTTMCPGPVEEHPDVNFNLNYRDGDTFQAGGLQIQVFDGQRVIANVNARSEQLQTDGETITWTQKLSIWGGTAIYRVKTGNSTTWGNFGGDELTVFFPTSLDDLNAYSPDISISKSGVGWQSDHVSSMTLSQVRYYSNGTLVFTDSTPRTIQLTTP
jgi:hypothetical protein